MLGIVIVNYRDYDRTERFIREEVSRIRMPYRVVIVDNGGEADKAGVLAETTGAEVLVRANDGFAAGCNAGADALKDADVLLFSNPDLHLASEDVVEALVDKLSADPSIGVIGPEIMGLDGRRQSPEPYMGLWKRYVWMYLSTPFLSKQAKRRKFLLDYSEEAPEGYHYRVMGSFFMCPRKVWEAAGGMDPHTFLYAEESILSERMKAIGKKVCFLPTVRVIHEHGATIRSHIDRTKAAWLRFQSDAYFYRTYKGYPAWQTKLVGWVYRLILNVKR